MMISTRGRYALRFLLDLASQGDNEYIPMRVVAERENISLKYLEQIVPIFSKNHLVDVSYGKGGGYKLSRKPGEYTVGEILRLTEGDLAPVSCLGCESEVCERADHCKTLPMWREFNDITNKYFDGVTLASLMNGTVAQV